MDARRILLAACVVLSACGSPATDEPPRSAPSPAAAPAPADPFAARRERMVREQIEERGVGSPGVLAAMRSVPRHEFVPAAVREFAYGDHALSIGFDQTISQPYIVAIMTEVADIPPGGKVLEIGTGSGYGAAVASRVAGHVFTIEILEPLAERAKATLARLGYDNVTVRHGDGYQGWPEEAPFDAILVTAAPGYVPEPLKEQLRMGANLVIPVGERDQWMQVITRKPDGYVQSRLFPVRFVPMTGEAQQAAEPGPATSAADR